MVGAGRRGGKDHGGVGVDPEGLGEAARRGSVADLDLGDRRNRRERTP